MFQILIRHRVFHREPMAINTAQDWMRDIDAAVERNGGIPVTWGWKDIQNRFRAHKHSYTLFRDALREFGLITVTTRRPSAKSNAHGECSTFAITRLARKLVGEGSFQWLSHLLNEPKIRHRNQAAISKRKRTRRVYVDPIKRIIDTFNHSVRFEPNLLLYQLRADRVRNAERYCSGLHHLLAIERRIFDELELTGGRIYNEFAALPLEYRIAAKLERRVYVARVGWIRFVPSATSAIPENWEAILMLDPELYAYGESLGLAFSYEYDGVGVFGKRGDPELPAKVEKVKVFILRKFFEKLGVRAEVGSVMVTLHAVRERGVR